MRKGVFSSIVALTAGAGLAFGQGPGLAGGPPAGGFDGLTSSAGLMAPPMGSGGVDGPGIIPAPESAPNGAPIYPPPGIYGATPYKVPDLNPAARTLAPHWWVNSEYLMWWAKNQSSRVPYITTGARAEGGVIGGSTTQTLVGDSDIGYGLFSGFRISGGWFKDADRRIGFELGGFLLAQRGVYFNGISDVNGVPVIARPFVNASTGTQGVLTIAFPNLASGSALFKTTSQTWGAEGSGVYNIFRSCPEDKCLVSTNMIAGFRYLEMDESIDITSSSTLLGSNQTSFAGLTVSAPATITVQDHFQTTNRFYGGQIGFKSEAYYGKWYASMTGKIAGGVMNEVLEVWGQSGVLDPTRGVAATVPGGLLAGASSITTRRHDEFAFIPEASLTLGYNWCNWLTTFIGYNAMYISKVIRPGDQITNVINTSLVPTSPSYGTGGVVATPNVLMTQSEFWLQGVTFGVQLKY